MIYLDDLIDAREAVEQKESAYLRQYGWKQTCNTPGAYWVWIRDFAAEDAARHARWKEGGPGPMGWSSEPKPWGVMTVSRDLAVGMTRAALEELQDAPEDAECED